MSSLLRRVPVGSQSPTISSPDGRNIDALAHDSSSTPRRPPVPVIRPLGVIPIEKLNYYWDTLRPTLAQLSYADNFFTNGKPNFLFAASKFREFPLSDVPEVAFLGRSNVGKSSLLNALFNRTTKPIAHASSKPGRTKTMNAFGIGASNQGGVRLKQKTQDEHARVIGRSGLVVVDMPGYGMGSRESWGPEIVKYLCERKQMRRAFLLIDAEHGLKPGDLQILNIMRRSAIPHQVILSKADKLIDFKNKIPTNEDKMNKRLAMLRETSERIRDIVQPSKERRFSALGEILACSAEKKINGKRLGIDAVRFAVMQAAGLEPGIGSDPIDLGIRASLAESIIRNVHSEASTRQYFDDTAN